MPKHLGIGVNSQTYTVAFAGAKQATITFDKPFAIKPSVQLTLGDSGTSPAFRSVVTTTGCTVKLQTNWTGQIDVMVTARANNL